MHIYHGTNPLATLPRIVGHEVAGEIVEVGSHVQTVAVGDHVVIELFSYCGDCYACIRVRPNVCKEESVYVEQVVGCMRMLDVLSISQVLLCIPYCVLGSVFN